MSVIALDWDGTLLDSRFRHRRVLADVLKLKGAAVNPEALCDFVPFKAEGRTTVEYVSTRFPDLSEAPTVVRNWIERIELAQYLRLDELFTDSPQVLRRLSEIYPLILVSARQNREALVEQVARLGVAHYFHRVLCVQPGPDAGVKKALALKPHLASRALAVVGDTEVDEVCAGLIGSDFYAVNHGFRSADWWNRRGRFSFASLSDVCEKLLAVA